MEFYLPAVAERYKIGPSGYHVSLLPSKIIYRASGHAKSGNSA